MTDPVVIAEEESAAPVGLTAVFEPEFVDI